MESSQTSFTEKFRTYFAKPLSEEAAKSLADGAEIEFHVTDSGGKTLETFTFTRKAKQNQIISGPARDPQLGFTLTPGAAEAILADPATDIGTMGVNIAKLIVSSDANKRVSIQFRSGFFTLFTQGYFGIVKAGGGAFATFLASRGLNGIDGIKAALKKVKG